MHSKYAFSLVELMVAVGIVGVLVTLALPRYHAFIVQARRGEAKSNLHQIATLQEAYRAEHGTYYSGAAMRGSEGIGYKDKYGNPGDCNDYSDARDEGLSNRLGFRPKACADLRYFYQLVTADTVVAFAYSDASRRHIYPDCDGAGPVECGYNQGDAVRLALSDANPVVCRNITKHCPPGVGGTLPPPPTPTPPCTCSAWTLGTPELTDTTVNLANECECNAFSRQRTDTRVCTGTPPCPTTTRTVTLTPVKGNKLINFSTTAECPCNCAPGDTRSACVSCNIVSDVTSACSATGLINKYPCEEVTGTKTRTIDRDPNSATCQDTTTTLDCTVCGTKVVTLPSWTLGSWGTSCERNNSQTNPAAADYCQQTATDNRICDDPCSGLGSTTCSAPPYNCSGTRTRTQDCTGCATTPACDDTDANKCCSNATTEVNSCNKDNSKWKFDASKSHVAGEGCCACKPNLDTTNCPSNASSATHDWNASTCTCAPKPTTCTDQQHCTGTTGGSWSSSTCTHGTWAAINYTWNKTGSQPSCAGNFSCNFNSTTCNSATHTLDATNCTCTLKPTTCDENTECCDGNTVKAQPSGFTCNSGWKGRYNIYSATRGCCINKCLDPNNGNEITSSAQCPPGDELKSFPVCCQTPPISTCDSINQCCYNDDNDTNTPSITITISGIEPSSCTGTWIGEATDALGAGCCVACETGTDCCDGNDRVARPTSGNLSKCTAWRGTYNAHSITNGCCQCEPSGGNPLLYYHADDNTCECDASRNFILGSLHFNASGEPYKGQCDCAYHHYEAPYGFAGEYNWDNQINQGAARDRRTECKACVRPKNLRRYYQNSDNSKPWKWGCETCTLSSVFRDPNLLNGGTFGSTGGECGNCAGGNCSGCSPQFSAISDYTSAGIDSAWQQELKQWYDNHKSASPCPQLLADNVIFYASNNPNQYAPQPVGADVSSRAALWQWYRNVFNKAKAESIPDACYPPIPPAWNNYYTATKNSMSPSGVVPASLENHSHSGYIFCTIAGIVD